MRVQSEVVLLEVGHQVVGAQHLRDADQLVVVVVTVKKGLAFENLCSATKKKNNKKMQMHTTRSRSGQHQRTYKHPPRV